MMVWPWEEKASSDQTFLGLPWWRAWHQCCHWVSHQWGGAWAARQDWRGWKAKSNYDHHHGAIGEWQDIPSIIIIVILMIVMIIMTAGGRWEFVPIDGGRGAHGGQLRYHIRSYDVISAKISFKEENSCDHVCRYRCSSTRRRRGRAWRRCSTWRWSMTRPTCLASGKSPQCDNDWILYFSKVCPDCRRRPGRGLLPVDSASSCIFQAKTNCSIILLYHS